MHVPLFESPEQVADYVRILDANAEAALAYIRREGGLFVAPGIRCTILDAEVLGSARRVAINEGAHEGRTGWTVKSLAGPSSERDCVVTDTGGDVPLFPLETDLNRFVEAAREGKKAAVLKILDESQALKAQKSRCHILERRPEKVKILIIEGKFTGSEGWMASSWINEPPS